MRSYENKPLKVRIPGENVGSPIKGWRPLDPMASTVSWYFKEILLGAVICFTLALETIGFALSANIDASQGIHAAWILNVVCGLFGGRPGIITGFSGASTALFRFFLPKPVYGKTVGEGIEYIYPSVILCGCLMSIFGLLRLGDRTMNILSASVMIGFCCGLAINICKSQFHFYEEKVCEFNEMTGKKVCHEEFVRGIKAVWMAVITIVVMLVKEYLPLIGRRWPAFKLVPSPLVAIVVSIVIEYAIVRPSGSKTPNINDVGPFLKETAFPMPFWMQTRFYDETKLILDGQGWGKIFTQGVLLFGIGTVESLMVIEVMNQFTATVGHNNQHMAVLGLANVISGFLGGVGGDAMIGVTTLNGLNGAEGRVSSVSCGIGIMLLIMVAYPILNFIPVAAIGGIMFVVVIHIFKWYSIDMVICALVPSRVGRILHLPSRKVFRSDVAIIVVIVLLTFYYNQLYGILAGIGINFLVFALQVKTSGGSWSYLWRVLNTPIHAERTLDESCDRVFYYVRGPLYFKSFRVFKTLFDYYNDPPKIVIYMEDSRMYDYSSLDGLNKVCKLYKSIGKSVEVMNLSEMSKLVIQESDGSRGYCCCSKSFGFQWMLGDIVVGGADEEKVKTAKPKDNDDTSNSSESNSTAEPDENNSADKAEAQMDDMVEAQQNSSKEPHHMPSVLYLQK